MDLPAVGHDGRERRVELAFAEAGRICDEDVAICRAIGEHALTLASGITPDNAHLYMDDVDGFMVATGINRDGDFYNIEAAKLARLLKLTRDHGARS